MSILAKTRFRLKSKKKDHDQESYYQELDMDWFENCFIDFYTVYNGLVQ